MSREPIYLDWAATTPIHAEVAQLIQETAIAYPGNPSSIHTLGKEAKEKLELERTKLATLLDVDSSEILFTSGGSEANSIILQHFIQKRSSVEIIRSSIEHPIVSNFDRVAKELGHQVHTLPVNSYGVIDTKKLNEALNTKTALVSIIGVHNITGAIEPIEEIVEIVRSFESSHGGRNIHIHCDMVQAFGKIPLPLKSLGIDSAAFGAHKFQGPRGVGFLWHRGSITPLSVGGGQEQGMRPGTEDVASITAMVKAAEIATLQREHLASRLRAYRNILIEGLTSLGATIISHHTEGVPGILYVSCAPVPSEVWVRSLSDRGIYISAGSACSSAKRKKSGVSPLGLSDKVSFSTLRISMGAETKESDIIEFLHTMKELQAMLTPRESR